MPPKALRASRRASSTGNPERIPSRSAISMWARILVVEFRVETPPPGEREQPIGQLTQRLHDLASMNRATSAVACSHFSTSTRSCFRPAFVRA